LRRAAVGLANAVNASISLPRALAPRGGGIGGVIVTGPPQDPEAHLRTVTVTSAGIVNRSPSGTGMAALMSVLDAMGLLPEDGRFVLEGIAGSVFRGRVASRTMVADLPAILPEIEGTAWITGEHAFVIDEEDPMREGILL
jgi:proline racemase